MHELSVTENILELAVRYANQNQAERVTDLHITIGRLASIVDDSVQFYWDIISQDTLCEGATLHFTRVPAQLQCQQCQTTFTLEDELTPCPTCGGMQTIIVSGEEFFLDSIEIEKVSVP